MRAGCVKQQQTEATGEHWLQVIGDF